MQEEGNLQEDAREAGEGEGESDGEGAAEAVGPSTRPEVGDTAEWGSSYSLGDLENAMEHYSAAAALPRPDSSGQHGRRLRCKAAKCGVAMAMRMLKRGGAAHALARSTRAFETVARAPGGDAPQREEQELMSEAMQARPAPPRPAGGSQWVRAPWLDSAPSAAPAPGCE